MLNNASDESVEYKFSIDAKLVDKVDGDDFALTFVKTEENEGRIKGGHAVKNVNSNDINLALVMNQGGEDVDQWKDANEFLKNKFIMTFLHELGHSAGLGHIFEEHSIFYERWKNCQMLYNFMSYPDKDFDRTISFEKKELNVPNDDGKPCMEEVCIDEEGRIIVNYQPGQTQLVQVSR
jgi:hypothetical protein